MYYIICERGGGTLDDPIKTMYYTGRGLDCWTRNCDSKEVKGWASKAGATKIFKIAVTQNWYGGRLKIKNSVGGL